MNAPQQSVNESRAIIAERWPDISTALARASHKPELALYDEGEYPTIVAGGLRLASAWNPVGEAQLQLESIPLSAKCATLFGIGMGYLPLTALETHTELETLIVVPLNMALFNTILDFIDMSAWLNDPRVCLKLPSEFDRLPPVFAATIPTLQLAETSAERLRDLIKQHLSLQHSNSFQQSRGAMIADNIQRNLIAGCDDQDVGVLFDTCDEGQSVIVCGAGPTLDQSMNEIGRQQEQGAMLIVVDAALNALLQNGISPDYVVTIDPIEWVQEFLTIQQLQSSDIGLVYFPSAYPQAVSGWSATRYCAVGTHERFSGFVKKKPVRALFSSGSVIHPATDLAVRTGTRHVIFAGADFGYPLQSTHAQGVIVNQPVNQTDNATHTVRNYCDEVIPSSMNLISYYRDLERYIAKMAPPSVRFSNLGVLSAKIQGVQCVVTDEEYVI